jgi:hypothetical protein
MLPLESAITASHVRQASRHPSLCKSGNVWTCAHRELNLLSMSLPAVLRAHQCAVKACQSLYAIPRQRSATMLPSNLMTLRNQ